MNHTPLGRVVAAVLILGLTGCSESLLGTGESSTNAFDGNRVEAECQDKLRHPQLKKIADATGVAGKGAGADHVFIGFNEYEADGVSRRVLDSYGITRRVLEEYGVTRRVMDAYGITRRVLEEYGVSRRVMDAYGITRRVLESYGITAEVLDDWRPNLIDNSLLTQYGTSESELEGLGVTRRVLDDYGVTRRVLDDYGLTDTTYDEAVAAFERSLRLKVRIDGTVPGMFVSLGTLPLATFLEETSDDNDISFVEIDIPVSGPALARSTTPANTELMSWGIERSAGGT